MWIWILIREFFLFFFFSPFSPDHGMQSWTAPVFKTLCARLLFHQKGSLCFFGAFAVSTKGNSYCGSFQIIMEVGKWLCCSDHSERVFPGLVRQGGRAGRRPGGPDIWEQFHPSVKSIEKKYQVMKSCHRTIHSDAWTWPTFNKTNTGKNNASPLWYTSFPSNHQSQLCLYGAKMEIWVW